MMLNKVSVDNAVHMWHIHHKQHRPKNRALWNSRCGNGGMLQMNQRQRTVNGWIRMTLASRKWVHIWWTHWQNDSIGWSDRSSQSLPRCQVPVKLYISCLTDNPQQGGLCQVLCSTGWADWNWRRLPNSIICGWRWLTATRSLAPLRRCRGWWFVGSWLDTLCLVQPSSTAAQCDWLYNTS